VVYYDYVSEDLRYTTCASNCTIAASWQSVPVDTPGDVGLYPSLGIEPSGRVHVAYRDATGRDLKYALGS